MLLCSSIITGMFLTRFFLGVGQYVVELREQSALDSPSSRCQVPLHQSSKFIVYTVEPVYATTCLKTPNFSQSKPCS